MLTSISTRLNPYSTVACAPYFKGATNDHGIDAAFNDAVNRLMSECEYGLIKRYQSSRRIMSAELDKSGFGVIFKGLDITSPSPKGTCRSQALWMYGKLHEQLKDKVRNIQIVSGGRTPFYERPDTNHFYLAVMPDGNHEFSKNDIELLRFSPVPDNWFIIDPSFHVTGFAKDLSSYQYKVRSIIEPSYLNGLSVDAGGKLSLSFGMGQPFCSGREFKHAMNILLDRQNLVKVNRFIDRRLSEEKSLFDEALSEMQNAIIQINDGALIFFMVGRSDDRKYIPLFAYQNPGRVDVPIKSIVPLVLFIARAVPGLFGNNSDPCLHFMNDLINAAKN
jgi:hypothetical protein